MQDATSDPSVDEIETESEGDDAVLGRLAALEELLGRLIDRMGTEVRTRRVVVTEDDGFERVVIAPGGTHGEVTVAARTPSGRSTAAELYAHDRSEGDRASAGLAVIDGGNVLVSVDSLGRAERGNPYEAR